MVIVTSRNNVNGRNVSNGRTGNGTNKYQNTGVMVAGKNE